MKIKGVIIALFTLLVLAACIEDSKEITFQNESDNWTVEYTATVKNENQETNRLYVEYIGEGEAPDRIDYRIVEGSGEAERTNATLEQGVLNSNLGSCSGCAVSSENDEVEITIEWDGNSETIQLNSD